MSTSTYLTREELAQREPLHPLARVDNFGPDGRAFPWGPIVEIHAVGDIAIVEFLRDNSRMVPITERSYHEHGKPSFSAFLANEAGHYRSTSHAFNTLDSALVGAIAIKREGPNSRAAAAYFDRMTLPVTALDD